MKNGRRSNCRQYRAMRQRAPATLRGGVRAHLQEAVVRNLRKVHTTVGEFHGARHTHAAALANTVREIC